MGATDDLFARPRHPYTEALLSTIPRPDPRLPNKAGRIRLKGEVADPANPPSGCLFHPRCRYAQERCRVEAPKLRAVGNGQMAACHFSDGLDLQGA